MVWISKGKIFISFIDSILICHFYILDIFLKKGLFWSWWPSSYDDLQDKFSISLLWLGRHTFPLPIHWSHNAVNVHLLASFFEFFFAILWIDDWHFLVTVNGHIFFIGHLHQPLFSLKIEVKVKLFKNEKSLFIIQMCWFHLKNEHKV